MTHSSWQPELRPRTIVVAGARGRVAGGPDVMPVYVVALWRRHVDSNTRRGARVPVCEWPAITDLMAAHALVVYQLVCCVGVPGTRHGDSDGKVGRSPSRSMSLDVSA